MLPHCQFRRMRIFTNQGLKNLVVVVTPVIYRAGINVIMQFLPVRVVNALSPHFFNDCRQRCVLSRKGDLNVELQVPFGIAETFFFTRMILDFHQLHDVLLGDLRRCEFCDIAFNQLASLEKLKRTVAGKFQTFVRRGGVFRLAGNHVNTGTFAYLNIPFNFQHDDGFADHRAADAFFIRNKTLSGKFITDKIDPLLDAIFQLGGKLLI